MIAYVAHDRRGMPLWLTMRPRRQECQERATEVMLCFTEYDALGTTQKRWKQLRTEGCRIRKYVLRELA